MRWSWSSSAPAARARSRNSSTDGAGWGSAPARKRQRLDDDDLLAEDAQRFTARDEDDQLRHGRSQLAHHLADRRQHVLAVVEHDRSTALGEHDGRPRRPTRSRGLPPRPRRPPPHANCAEQGDGTGPAVTCLEAGGQLQGQPGLADAAGTGQRDDRARHGQPLQVGALLLPTDQPPGHHGPSIAARLGSNAQASASSMAAANAS